MKRKRRKSNKVINKISIMNEFRYQLERYRGRGSRYVCPQCGRKYVFTRYVDTHNNNQYVSESVGKCNRLDKCGYHYTPLQYFEDNPWLRDKEFSFFSKHRENEKKKKETPPPPPQRALWHNTAVVYGAHRFLVIVVQMRHYHKNVFDFRRVDLFYRIKKISWDSTSLSAPISCQKS
jgi:hypothetical protein